MKPKVWTFAVGALALPLSCAPSSVTDKARSGGDPIQIEGDLPCDIEKILGDVCQHCHTRPPRNGAPFPLVTYGDTQAMIDGRIVVSYVGEAVAAGRMPLAPMTLSEAQRAVLVAWASQGGPRREGSCSTNDAGVKDAAPEARSPVDAAQAEDAGADGDVEVADGGEK